MSKTVSRLTGAEGFETSRGATMGFEPAREGSTTFTSASLFERGPGAGAQDMNVLGRGGYSPSRFGEPAGRLTAMSATATPPPGTSSVLRRTRHIGDRIGDGALYGLTAAAAILALATIAA